MTKIKICGITTLEDALLVAELGAWAVGFIFVKSSPRYVEPEKAAEIIEALPENIEKIGVFVNPTIDEIQSIIHKVKLTKIQLHGNESKEFCTTLKNSTGLSIIKAIRVKEFDDLKIIQNYKETAVAILLDSYSPQEFGGTGKSFNWEIAVEAKKYGIPIILAGGVNQDNIKEAYSKLKPYAIDISSGVELKKGIKDHKKLKDLFNEANK